MQLFTLTGAVAAALLPLLAQAAVQLTNSAYTGIASGKEFTLTWSGDGSPVDLIFESGPSGDLKPVATLKSGASGTSATVTIPDVPSGTYAFAIKQGSSTNYSPQFTVAGSAAPSASAPASSAVNTPPSPSETPYYPVDAGTVTNTSYATGSASGTGYPSATGSTTPFLGAAGRAEIDFTRIVVAVVGAGVVAGGFGLLA